MKLSNLQTLVANADTPETVKIFHPSGEPYRGADGQPSTMTVVGAESKLAIAARHDRARRWRAERTTQQSSEGEPTDAELRVNRVDNVADLVTAWSGWEDNNGQPLECTPANVRAVLGAVDHILAQVETAINRHSAGTFFTLTSRN